MVTTSWTLQTEPTTSWGLQATPTSSWIKSTPEVGAFPWRVCDMNVAGGFTFTACTMNSANGFNFTACTMTTGLVWTNDPDNTQTSTWSAQSDPSSSWTQDPKEIP